MQWFRRREPIHRPGAAGLGPWLTIAAVSLLVQACDQPTGPAFEDDPGVEERAIAEPGVVRLTTGPLPPAPPAQSVTGQTTVSTGVMTARGLAPEPGSDRISTTPAPVSSMPSTGPVAQSAGTVDEAVISTPGADISMVTGAGANRAQSVGSADIEVTKTASAPEVKVGEGITYTMTIRNNGPDAATAVTSNDPLPALVTFVSFVSLNAPGAAVCVFSAGAVNCTADLLQSGEQLDLVFTVTAAAPGTATNTATGGSAVDDPVPGNNSASAVTEILALEADIEVTKTTSATEVILGQDFTYTMTVRNNGPDAATSVTMEDVLPASVSFVSFVSLTGPGGVVCTFSLGTVDCTATTLLPGEQFVLTMTVKASGLGPVTNTATATSATDDPVPGNNSASVETLLIGEGCGHGFWKNWPSAWAGTGYAPAQTVGTVFASSGRAGLTLAQALALMGGKGVQGASDILLRAAVAALLNAAHPDVVYPLTTTEVLAQVNAAFASGKRGNMLGLAETLDGYNNLGCPLP